MIKYLIFAFILLLVAVVLFIISRRQRLSAGLPPGKIAYSDTSLWGKVEKPLYDPATGLVGKPDYLVESEGSIIPVEVKSSWAPPSPHEGHVLQLAAYCYLVEHTTGKRPPHGLLHYRNRTFSIEYTPGLEQNLMTMIDSIHGEERKKDIPRSHEYPARCEACGYKGICDQKLK
jgi:CRISPR-associated exonuclease Cas4